MKPIYFFLSLFFLTVIGNAQKEFHVFPITHHKTPGTPEGTGSISNPWDLETALNQKTTVVNGGDIIWLHEGIYKGQFISTLNSNIPNKYITVASFNNDKVVLDGNSNSNRGNVLQVKGKQVIFKDFEVSCLGEFTRYQVEPNFRRINGVDHPTGEDCKFINLRIHDVPGSGFGSWKNTGGTIIENCIIYNNGYFSKSRGSGVGMYVQNNSEKERLIRNNTIFNNFYKGVEVWSANKNADQSYVKNITLDNNIIFNNGTPAGVFKDNLIVATDDRNGMNITKNINIINNVFYHNTNMAKNEVGGDAPSLTLGYNANAPVEDITVHDNIIIGRNNALRLLHIKKMSYRNNISYAGYVHFMNSVVAHINPKNWDFDNNTYYTKNNRTFRISKYRDFAENDWKSTYKIDNNSKTANIRDFNLKPILSITPINSNLYRVALFNKLGKDVEVDLSKLGIPEGRTFKIYDAENGEEVIRKGVFPKEGKITFPMNNTAFKMPFHNNQAQKTLNNFGVYFIEFETKNRKKSLLARILDSIF